MKNKSIKYIVGALAFIFVLTSCSKNEDAIATLQPANLGILTFSSEQEFQSTLEKVSSMKPDQRVEWEKSKGFKSFGTICDEVYKSIDPTKFKSLQEVKDTVNALNEYLEMGQNKDGKYFVDPKESANPARFLMNNDKMYIIKDSVYKQFDNVLVSVSLAEIQKLKERKNIRSIKTENVKYKVITYGYSSPGNVNYFEQWGINGNYAIRVRFHMYIDGGYREHIYTFNNYKWTLWIYWGDYLSHTFSVLKVISTDDYQSPDPGQPLIHRDKLLYYYNADDYAVTNSININDGSGTPTNTPYFKEIQVDAHNGKGCQISEHYIRP